VVLHAAAAKDRSAVCTERIRCTNNRRV